MATIKSFTSLEQSKKLVEILPLESADMWLSRCTITDFGDGVLKVSYAVEPCNISQFRNTREDIPCWSLAALLGVLPEIDGSPLNIEKVKAEDGYEGYYYHIEYKDKILIPYSKNPIDACVAMIKKLHELNLL